MNKNFADFYVDNKKCISCGNCIKVCPGQLLNFNEEKKIKMKEINCFGWDGCWKCQHCLAVCPVGAISVLNKKPQNSIPVPDYSKSGDIMDSIMVNRRAHRRYLNKNVDKKIIENMLNILQAAPNGGNKSLVEYVLIDDRDQLKYFHDLIYKKMIKLARKGIYAEGYDEKSFNQLKVWEKIVRPDMLFCGAPHVLIPHAPIGIGCYVQDVNIACAYFELLCASRGLGAIPMTYPLDVLNLMPEEKAMLQIPQNHYVSMFIGFSYPEIKYSRGVQKEDNSKIKILKFI